MQNNKILKQRAKLYDDLLTCVIADCGHKFSTGRDLELHIIKYHHQKMTAESWWKQFQKALFADKDDLDASDFKSGYNTFRYGELADAAKAIIQKNRGDFK